MKTPVKVKVEFEVLQKALMEIQSLSTVPYPR